MLRILKDGKPITIKDQEKLCKKDRTQNVGRVVKPTREDAKIARYDRYKGLRPVGGDIKDGIETNGATSKGESSSPTKREREKSPKTSTGKSRFL